MNESPMMNIAITVGEAATDAREVARRLALPLSLTDFGREQQARILDRLAEELTQAAADLRRAR